MTDASAARTRQTHRSDAATALARSAMHEPRTARLATTPTNPPPHPPPTHAKSCVILRDGPHVLDVQPCTPAEASPMHANSPTRIPVHLRCTQYNQRREPTRYARNHVITQWHHGMHAMHSRTHTRACPCISDAHRTNTSANKTDGATNDLSRPNRLYAPTYIAYVR